MSILPRLVLTLLLLLATGCASRGPAPVTQLDAQRCEAASRLGSATPLQLDQGHPETLRFDGSATCVSGSDHRPATYAAVRLPKFREDWVLTLHSQIAGQSLFAPEVFTLDAQGQVLRKLDFDRFTLRGDQLVATLFFNQDNAAERYLLVRSAHAAVGTTGRQVVSGAFMVPILTSVLPIVYMQGTERERSYTLSHNGLVQLQARRAAPNRRVPQTHDLARAELGAMAR